jgi:hypothetical protein
MGIAREARLGLDKMTPAQREAWHRENAVRCKAEMERRLKGAEAHRQAKQKKD